MNIILSGNVLWSFDFEVENRNRNEDYAFHFSGIKPFHCHNGEIFLMNDAIKVVDDHHPLTIPLSEITELFLGYDDIYSPSLGKNFGMFWQPLRITVNDEKRIYLIVNYDYLGTKNKIWFNTLTEMFS